MSTTSSSRRFACAALLLVVCFVAACGAEHDGFHLGTAVQAEEPAASLENAIVDAVAAPPGQKNAAFQKLQQELSKFTNATRSGLAQKRNSFIETLGNNTDPNMQAKDSVAGAVADVDKKLDGLKSKYQEVRLADPKDFEDIYTEIAKLYLQLAAFDAQMNQAMQEIESEFRQAAELLAMTRQAQAILTGAPYDPQNPNTDPLGSAELEHLLGGIAKAGEKKNAEEELITVPRMYEYTRVKLVAEIRRLQERVDRQLEAVREAGVVLPNLGDMRPGYLFPSDAGKPLDDAFVNSVIQEFAACALSGERLQKFKDDLAKAFDTAAGSPTKPTIPATQLESALGPDFFKGQSGKTIIVADAVATTFRDDVSKATVKLLDVIVEMREKENGTLSFSCGPPANAPPDCKDKRYYVTADVVKAVLGQRMNDRIKKIIESTNPNAPGLDSKRSATLIQFRQAEMELLQKDLDKQLAPLKPVDEAVAAKLVLGEGEVVAHLKRKKDVALNELQRFVRQASDVLNGAEVMARTKREEAGVTGRFFDDMAEAFSNSGTFLYTYIASGADDRAFDLATNATIDGSPRLRFAKISAKARGALVKAEADRITLLRTEPTDAELTKRIDAAYGSLRAAVDTLDGPNDSVKKALVELADSIESRRALGKTGVLVAAAIVVVATGGTAAPVVLIGIGVEAGLSVGINVADGLTGRPREIVLRESVVDVGLAAIGTAAGFGTNLVMTRLLAMNSLTNRCINQTILGRSMRHAVVGSLVSAELFVGLNAVNGKLPWQYTDKDREKLGWTMVLGGSVGFTMSTIVGLAGRSVGVRAANLDGPSLKKLADFVDAPDLSQKLAQNPADKAALQQLNSRVNKYFNEQKYALAFGDPELFAVAQRLQLLAANLAIVKPPPKAIDFTKKPSLPQVISLLREQSIAVKVPAGPDPAYLSLLQSKWRGGLHGMKEGTLRYVLVYEKWMNAARRALQVGDADAALQLLENGNFWATEAAIGDIKRMFNLLPTQQVGRLKTDAIKSSRDRLGTPGDGTNIHQDNFKWFEELMTVNNGKPTQTLGPTETIDVGGGNVIRRRAVFTSILDETGQPVRFHMRTLEIIGAPGPANPNAKEYWVHYTTDIDKLVTLRNYVKTRLLPAMAAGNGDAAYEAAYLISGSVPYELGSSGIARVLHVMGMEAAGTPAAPFRQGYGIDLNAFGSDSLKTFIGRMQATVEPP